MGEFTPGTRGLESFSEKNVVRSYLLEKRLSLPLQKATKKIEGIAARVLGLDLFIKAKTLALYSPIKNEVGTGRIFEKARSDSKEVFFPRVQGKVLKFLRVDDLTELERGRFGILEPRPNAAKIDLGEIDIVIVPGVAFDLLCTRMGYGKGFYDRALRGIDNRKLIGLAYNFQVLSRIPAEERDIGLGMLITESGIIFAQGG